MSRALDIWVTSHLTRVQTKEQTPARRPQPQIFTHIFDELKGATHTPVRTHLA